MMLAFAFMPGCYAPVIEGAQQGYDASRRASLKTNIPAQDPEAQYKLGNTYCCRGGGPMDNLTIYDNPKATYWYCKAARQGYTPAQLRLARLYSGDAIRGLHIALRASALIGDSQTDLSLALMWARLAAKSKNQDEIDEATSLRDEIFEQASEKERTRAAVLGRHWSTVHCEWDQVFSDSKPKQP